RWSTSRVGIRFLCGDVLSVAETGRGLGVVAGLRRERLVVDAAGGILRSAGGGDSGNCAGASRAASLEVVRLAGKAIVRTMVLDRCDVGICRDLGAHDLTVRCALVCVRSCCVAWSAARTVRSILGLDVSAGRTVRRVSAARLYA